MSDFMNRRMRASKPGVHCFKEVEADTRGMGQSVAVVMLSSPAAGIGTAPQTGGKPILLGTVLVFLGWCVWAYLAYLMLALSILR